MTRNSTEFKALVPRGEVMVDKNDVKESDENYFCHIVIPCGKFEESKLFYEKVLGWRIQEQPGTTCCWDILPSSRKGASAELNAEEEVVVPTIYTSNIDAKLELVENSGGKKLEDKTPIGEKGKYGYFALF